MMAINGILDCESVESTYASLGTLLKLSRADLMEVLNEVNVESFYELHPRWHESGEVILTHLVQERIGYPIRTASRTAFFHLTRVSDPSVFLKQGIRPLNLQIESIWGLLYSLCADDVPRAKWAAFRADFGKQSASSHDADLYAMKVGDQVHWGPYGLLVRDCAFQPLAIGNHDYLRTPEIVEDICNGFAQYAGIDLLARFQAHTFPCVVKFEVEEALPECTSTALYYLYSHQRNEALSRVHARGYDAQGVPIPPGRVLSATLVDHPTDGLQLQLRTLE